MKFAVIVDLAVMLFFSGYIFFCCYAYLTKKRFRLTLPRAAACVLISLLFTGISGKLHYGFMLLRRHVWFDMVSILLLAVLFSAGTALLHELLGRKKSRSVIRNTDKVSAFYNKNKFSSCDIKLYKKGA